MENYCSNCGKEINKCECNKNEDSGFKKAIKGIGYTLLLFLSYALVPSFIGALIYKIFKIEETLASFLGNLIYILGIIYYYREMFVKAFKDYKKHLGNYLGESFKYWGIGLLIMVATNLFLNYVVFPGQIANNEEVNRAFLESYKVIGFIQIVFMAPVIEELIFRYGIRKVSDNKIVFPILSGLVFGLPHALTGITSVLQLLYTVPYGALGWGFAALYNKTDNILTNISMHALHNCMVYLIIIMAL